MKIYTVAVPKLLAVDSATIKGKMKNPNS